MAGPLQAASVAVPELLATRGVLRVATPGDYAPYAKAASPGAPLRGVDVELAQEIAIDLGLRIEWVPTRWASLLEDARAGRFDVAIGGISRTPERLHAYPFARVLIKDQKSPLARCGEESRFDTLAEINRRDIRVITNPGGTNEQFARTRFPDAQLAIHADNLSVFDEILARRADVMVTDRVEARLRAQRQDGLCAVPVRTAWAPMQKAFMIAGSPELRDTIDGALGTALRRENYARRLDAWIDSPWEDTDIPVPQQLALLAEARLAVVVEVARWKWNNKAAIEDLPRERTLLAGLRAAAQGRGLSPMLVDDFFAAQIEAAKQLQRDLFRRWEKQSAGNFVSVGELDQTLRPRIDQLNAAMLEALARWDGGKVSRDKLGRLTLAGTSPRAVAMALAPLTAAEGT